MNCNEPRRAVPPKFYENFFLKSPLKAVRRTEKNDKSKRHKGSSPGGHDHRVIIIFSAAASSGVCIMTMLSIGLWSNGSLVVDVSRTLFWGRYVHAAHRR